MKRTITLGLLAMACVATMSAVAEARYRDSMNLYEYVRSEPVRSVDPSGRVTVLIHGIDNTNWYAKAAAAIKAVKPDEKVIEFKWGFHRPRTEITFGKDSVLLDSFYFHNGYPYPFVFWSPKTPETKKMELIMKGMDSTIKGMDTLLDEVSPGDASGAMDDTEDFLNRITLGTTKGVVKNIVAPLRSGAKVLFGDFFRGKIKKIERSHGGAKTKFTLTKEGLKMLAPFPPAGTAMEIWAGGMFPNKEKDAAWKLARKLSDVDDSITKWIEDPRTGKSVEGRCEPLRVLAFSSGARLLSRALALNVTKVDRVVLVGASVSQNDRNIAKGSRMVFNYYGRNDFMTRLFPLNDGAGSFGLRGARGRNVDNVFHGEWMNRKDLMERYVKDLVPQLGPKAIQPTWTAK